MRQTVRVAAVQMQSPAGPIAAKLERATGFVEQAARAKAELVLLPELAATDYTWTKNFWNSGEQKSGVTAQWLGKTSRQWGVWLGTSFLESDGVDFYNTFVLTGPDGMEAGRVRKQAPALWEAYLFKGDVGSHVIQTAIGTIGVGICFENQLAFVPLLMQKHSIDLMLMPHSAPSLIQALPFAGPIAADSTQRVSDIAGYYSRILGVPTVLANKCGPWDSGLRYASPSKFIGRSEIVDSDGKSLAKLVDEEQVIIADVLLDPDRKRRGFKPCNGRWVKKISLTERIACGLPERLGAMWYRLSLDRRDKARTVLAERAPFQ
jgi:N-carbamoylputrescine amidase